MQKRILLVEDEEGLRLFYGEELKAEGYDVIFARTAKKPPAAGADRPDLIILDIVMPVMDGMETLGQIMGRERKIPIVIHTSYPGYREDFMSWAADAYVAKSSDLRELKETVREPLEEGREGMRKVLAMILAGGRGERLYPLTRDRAKPAVPFGGIYRIIDFTLSNCINSDIRRIYVLTNTNRLPSIGTSSSAGTSSPFRWESSSGSFLHSRGWANNGIRGPRMPFSEHLPPPAGEAGPRPHPLRGSHLQDGLP